MSSKKKTKSKEDSSGSESETDTEPVLIKKTKRMKLGKAPKIKEERKHI